MNESDARMTLLVRAYETAPPDPSNRRWSEDDRGWATQAALQAQGEQAGTQAYIACRARLAGERLGSRDPGARRALRALTWQPWVGWALALAALAAGAASDAIGAAHRINVLAPPLLAVLVWNLAVYAAIIVRATTRRADAGTQRTGPLARRIARAAQALASPASVNGLSAPLAGFARDWAAASATLSASRVARVLHTAAAAFAAGALLGMYLRGFALEYLAGWESTFLDAASVHAILAVVLGPAATISGIALPDEAALAAIRWSASPGENAAPWIHLYALTVTLLVLVPRTALALGHYAAERRLVRRFPLSIDDAYFREIARARLGAAAEIRVVPYSCRLSGQAAPGLSALLQRVFGAKTKVGVAPTVPFGGEDALDPDLIPAAPVALVAALFSLCATPERENHGAFIDALAARVPRSVSFAVLVDESAFSQRFDEAGAAGGTRRGERRAAWRRLLAATGRVAVFVDLERPDLDDAQRALRAAIDRAPARAAQD